MRGYGQVVLLPEIAGRDGDLLLRVWQPGDAAGLNEAIRASREHLTPWMEWANLPLRTDSEHASRFSDWEARRRSGGDAIYGLFIDGQVAGSSGLHRRLAPDGLEIGYWVHVGYTRRGIASRAAAVLTDTAFSIDQITHVEIHHDAANAASEGVPRRLGFTLIGESPDQPTAPGESGIERRWRMRREDWLVARLADKPPRAARFPG